ncbi:MAG: hypothetical protein ACYC5O_05020 [Anaerolineae bacterium]
MPLAPEPAILDDEAPFRLALTSLLSMDEDCVNTYVVRTHGDSGRPAGYVQVRVHLHRPEASLTSIAPAPFTEDLAPIWERLLSAVSAWAGARGILRLYAAVPAGSAEEGELRRCGYLRYTADTVYRLPPPMTADRYPLHPRMRPQKDRDTWALQRLYAAVTPLRVQQAEGLTHNGWRMPTDDWNGHAWTRSYVLEDRDGLAAHVGLRQGRRSHRLRLVALPGARDDVPTILDHALAVAGRWPPRPIYCSVRHYQEGLPAALLERGFESLLSRSLTVRHSVLSVRPALEEIVLRLQNAVSTGYNSTATDNGGADGAMRQIASPPGSEWEYDKVPDY